MFTRGLIAVAAVGLMSAPAFAQDYSQQRQPGDQLQQNPSSTNTVNPTPGVRSGEVDLSDRPTITLDGEARVPVSTDTAAELGVPIQVVTNGPVPDTEENRERFGEPLSRAGRMTEPAGN